MSGALLPPNLLPDGWKHEAFIAGGFAANQELASDIDVWVTVPAGNDLAEVRRELLAHLHAAGYVIVIEPDLRLERNDDIEVDHYHNVLSTYKVAVLIRGNLKPIHLMVTNGNVTDVVDSFDVSTHMAAILNPFSDEPRYYHGDNWTPVNELPVVIKITPTTTTRLRKITDRYAEYRKYPDLALALQEQ